MARKRKTVKEDQYEVELSKDVAGQPDITKKEVTAQDSEQAIQQAKGGNTQQNFDQVTVKKKAAHGGPQTAPVAATPARAVSATQVESKGKKKTLKKKPARSRAKVDPNTFELTEGYKNTKFEYKYAIVLPIAYKKFMEKMKGSSDDIIITERMGRAQTQVLSAKGMDVLIENLIKAAKGRIVSNKDKATVIINGIMGSMKK